MSECAQEIFCDVCLAVSVICTHFEDTFDVFTVTNPTVQQKFHLPMSLPDTGLHDVLSDVSYMGSCDLQVLIL